MRLRLHYQLALPFVFVAVVATSAATLFAVQEVRRWVGGHRQEDAANAVELLRRPDYATNPGLLRIAAGLAGVDVVAFRSDGTVLASSFDAEVPDDVLALVRLAPRDRRPECGPGCAISYAGVPGQPGLEIAALAGRGSGDPLTDAVLTTIWMTALIGLVLLVGTSHVLARLLTARIQRLVDFTRQASPEGGRRAEEGAGDIGRLGAAFNQMLDRLADHRQALMRTEKLAVAGMMAARVAHDVRNPLSSIKMQSQLLEAQAAPGSDTSEVLRAVLRDIGQLEAVVSDLLETARPEAPSLMPASLQDLVAAAVAPMRAQLAHRRIALSVNTDSHAPPLLADRSRLHRALVNVLTNAAEASRAGGTIAVSTRFSQGHHLIEIADDGVGIDPAIRDQIFDPFVSGKPDGVGLGLVNARAIVESHGGRILLTPRVPHGTLVTIDLPDRTAVEMAR